MEGVVCHQLKIVSNREPGPLMILFSAHSTLSCVHEYLERDYRMVQEHSERGERLQDGA